MLTIEPENVTDVEKPLQITVVPPGFTVTDGVGLIRILKFLDGPLHPLLKGVTVMMVCMGIPDILTAVNAFMLPVPESGSVPIKIFVLVQLKTEPGMVAEVNVT